MAAGIVTITFLDGAGTSRTGRFWSSDGTVTGLLYPAPVLADSAGVNVSTIKAASTAPVATDTALVVSISPNSVNANGSATSANSAPVVIASDQAAVAVKQATAANLNAAVVGVGTAGAASGGVLTVQGVASMTALSVTAAGTTASGSSITANPDTIGGRAATANPTAVTDGQVVNTMHDKLGKLVAVGAIRTLKGTQKTTISASTAETTIVTQVASTFLDLYGLILANTGATTTKVDIRDTTGGSIIATVEVPTLETRGFMLPVDSAIAQTTVNTNWTAQCAASTAAMEVTAFFVKNT